MSGKVILITGGYGRLGREFAAAFIRNGDQVILTGRDQDKLEAAAKESGATPLVLDVTDTDQADSVRAVVEKRHGRIDVLINNAASFGGGRIEDLDVETVRRAMDTNVLGPFIVTRALLPLLDKSEAGLVIHVSSTSGHRADPGGMAYATSKFALMGLSEAMRKELRPRDIRVTTLSPSAIHFGDDNPHGKGARLNGRDIAEAAVFLSNSPGRSLFIDLQMWATNP